MTLLFLAAEVIFAVFLSRWEVDYIPFRDSWVVSQTWGLAQVEIAATSCKH